jgi:hypothetical protein
MHNIRTLRNQLLEQRNPGHEIGTFLLSHTNSLEYLIGHLEGYLEAAKADLEAENAFRDRVFHGLKQEKRDLSFEIFMERVMADTYIGQEGFNQFRHDVAAQFGHGEMLDCLLDKHGKLPEQARLLATLGDFAMAFLVKGAT